MPLPGVHTSTKTNEIKTHIVYIPACSGSIDNIYDHLKHAMMMRVTSAGTCSQQEHWPATNMFMRMLLGEIFCSMSIHVCPGCDEGA